jgi:copper chaperone
MLARRLKLETMEYPNFSNSILQMLIQVNVPSMVCQACVKTITNEIKANDPTATVEADLSQHQVTVNADLDPEQVKAMILAAGHEVA